MLLLLLAAAAPAEVEVGGYVVSVPEFSLRDNSFKVDLYLWFRWTDGELEPYESFTLEGSIESQEEPVVERIEGGGFYASVRLTARITQFWDVTDYPLDDHTLRIAIIEGGHTSDELRFVAHEAGWRPEGVQVPGWATVGAQVVVDEEVFETDFGHPELEGEASVAFSRATFEIGLERTGVTHLFKGLFTVWVAAAIAFLAFWIRPTNVDPRFGLPVGALFATVASMFVVAGDLRAGGILTLSDQLHLVAIAFIFVVVAQSVRALKLAETGREDGARRLDRVFGVLAPAAYILVNSLALA